MSTDTATAPVPETDGAEEDHHHHGPTDMLLIKIALILALVTAVEVAWSYLPWPDDGIGVAFEVAGLLVMMAFKFYVIASFFMHLKWDHNLLTGVFYFGLALAAFVYLAALLTFEFFGGGSPPYVG